MTVTFEQEFSGTIAGSGTAVLAHNITREGHIKVRTTDGDTAVADGFRVIGKKTGGAGLFEIAWTDDNTLTLTEVTGAPVDYEVLVKYDCAFAR